MKIQNTLLVTAVILATIFPKIVLTSAHTDDHHGGGTQTDGEEDCSTYIHTIDIPSSQAKIKLEYVSTDTTLSVRMTSDQQAFHSLGISPMGLMLGSEAVIGTTPNDVQLYSLTSGWVNVKEPSKQTLINGTFTQNSGGSVLEYTQLLNDGINKPLDANGQNIFIWAIGRENNINFGHSLTGQMHGVLVVNLTPCGGDGGDGFTIVERNDKELFAVHGKLAIAAFAVLFPLSALVAMIRKRLTQKIFNKQAWYVIHSGLNAIAYALTVGLFAISITAVNQTGADHFHSVHHVIGLVLFIWVTIQVILGIVRPAHTAQHYNNDTTHDDATNDDATNDNANVFKDELDKKESANEEGQSKSKLRRVWEVSHRSSAVVVLALGLYQIHSGLNLYSDIYESANYVPLFWIIMGPLTVVGIGVIVIARK